MALKIKILRSLTRLFIILVSLTRTLFSEKVLISHRCISGLMSNLIKKSWTVSKLHDPMYLLFLKGDSWFFDSLRFVIHRAAFEIRHFLAKHCRMCNSLGCMGCKFCWHLVRYIEWQWYKSKQFHFLCNFYIQLKQQTKTICERSYMTSSYHIFIRLTINFLLLFW